MLAWADDAFGMTVIVTSDLTIVRITAMAYQLLQFLSMTR